MRVKAHALMLALLLTPTAALAQQGAPAGASAGTGPIDRLLQRRTELALTQEQVQKLEAIRQKSAVRERELVGKVTEARGVAPGVPVRTQAATPAERRALRDKGQPYMGELRQLHLQQMQEARGVPPGVPIRTHAATPVERKALHDKGQPYMGELRQLHYQQMQEARAVLTADQNAKAWSGAGQCRGMGPGSMRGAGHGTMRGAGMRPHRSS